MRWSKLVSPCFMLYFSLTPLANDRHPWPESCSQYTCTQGSEHTSVRTHSYSTLLIWRESKSAEVNQKVNQKVFSLIYLVRLNCP